MFFKLEKLPEVIWSAVSITVAIAAVAVILADDNETDTETLSNHNLLDFFSEMGEEERLFELEIGGSRVGL